MVDSLAIVARGRQWQKAYKGTARHVWAVSSAFRNLPRADKVFNIHHPRRWESFLHDIKEKLVIAYDAEGFEDCERLPVEELVEDYGQHFSSSISWMLAYGAHLGYREIGLFGVDMFAADEFHHQRDGLFWIWGRLVERGITVYAPEENGVYLTPQLYGVKEQ